MIYRPKILVAEDTYLVAKDIQETLTSLGYLVTALVDTGKDALEKARELNPDLVLMDIKLKGAMDGIEAAVRINELMDIPIIYLTGISDDYTLLRAKRTEPSGYIIKPFNKADLHSAIEMALYKYKMENFIKDREELLTTTLKSVSDAVFTIDKNGFITYLNKNMEILTGMPQEEILGAHVDEVFTLYDEKHETKTLHPYKKVIKDGVRIELENQILKARDGKNIPVNSVNDPITDEKGKTLGVVISLQDITEQKKLQNKLEKAEKLEAIAVRAKTIGHEFNNLLTVIRGNIDLLKHSLNGDTNAYNLLDDAEKAAIRATDLTEQFLAFSRGDSVTQRVESVSELLKTTANSILGNSQIDFSFLIPDEIWKVKIDKGQMSQVYYSIIKILYKMIEDTGTIKISAENTTIVDKDMLPINPGNYVKILLQGKSAVIPGDLFKQLFDPYFTGTTRNHGLELSTSYSIIKKHGGYITVESRKNSGTIFFIYLPAVQEDAQLEEKNKDGEDIEGERRVLVMDDQELVRIIAGKMLSFIGFEVEFARHGAEAIDLYKEAFQNNKPFDCVILDLTIPWGMGARETISHLKEIDPAVKAIVSTGYSNDPSIYDYKELGFQGVIKKPYELQELNILLKSIIS